MYIIMYHDIITEEKEESRTCLQDIDLFKKFSLHIYTFFETDINISLLREKE